MMNTVLMTLSAEGAGLEESIITNLTRFVLVLCVSLTTATLPQLFSWVRLIPYTLLLVIVGMGLAFLDVRLVTLYPEVILFIFLPPLLFEAAWNVQWKDLKRDLLPITLFATLGVVITIAGIGYTLHHFTGIALPIALVIGACLAATDPVAVVALFKEVGAPRRLRTLMDGESLFNDGVAVVAFSLLIGAALGTETLSLQSTVLQFLTFVGIGLGIGLVVGFGISYLTQRFDLPLVEQSLTLVAAYGAYLVTEELGGSGVIAVVTAGIILGNYGSRIGMNPRTRVLVGEFWEFIAFFVNSIVFLLIGDQVQFDIILSNLDKIALTVAAVLLTRLISVFGLSALCNRLGGSNIDWRVQTVLWWGGLRGGVSVALALGLPSTLAGRDQIGATLFGVVLFTLLVEGLTTKLLLEKLHLLEAQPVRQQFVELLARHTAFSRMLERLQRIKNRPGVELDLYRYETTLLKGQMQNMEEKIQGLLQQQPDLQGFLAERITEELQGIEAETYADFVRAGLLDAELSPLLEEVLTESDREDSIAPA